MCHLILQTRVFALAVFWVWPLEPAGWVRIHHCRQTVLRDKINEASKCLME